MKHVLILFLATSILVACKNSSGTKAWPSKDVKDFITSCEREAIGGGLEKAKAENYCSCMQVKMEKQYPDIKDAAKVTTEDLQKPDMQAMIKDCLGK